MSKIEPNTTQTPNLYLDKLMYLLDEGELKTLLYAVRRTMGFHKGSDRISLSQFMNGNGHKDDEGNLVEYGTGLSKTTQIAVLKNLVSCGILIEVAPNTANLGTEWALQLDELQVDWDSLKRRWDKRRVNSRKQTKAARAAATAHAKQSGLFNRPPKRSIQQTTSGLSNRPPAVYPTDHQVVCSTDTQKKDRKPVRNNRKESGEDEAIEIVWAMLLAFCDGDKDMAVSVWQLQEAYSEKSKIPRPNIDTKDGREELKQLWWPALRDVLLACEGDLDRAITGLADGIASQSDWKADSVSTPKSIRKKALARIAATQRQANGQAYHGQSYAQYKI